MQIVRDNPIIAAAAAVLLILVILFISLLNLWREDDEREMEKRRVRVYPLRDDGDVRKYCVSCGDRLYLKGRYCPYCGSRVRKGFSYCRSCGRKRG